MTHTQRLQLLLDGKPVDRPLFAGWGHFMNLVDRDAVQFAQATIRLQEKFQFDFVKVMSNPYYMVEDTGLELCPPPDALHTVTRSPTRLPIQTPQDWERLPLPQLHKGALAREEEAIRRIVDAFQGDTPVLATIYTPIMWLSYLALYSGEMAREEQQNGCFTALLERYLIQQEHQVVPVLDYFAELNQRYMEELIKVGVSGFFYCSEHIRDAWSSPDAFSYFEKRYDLAALGAVEGKCQMNLLHVCGTQRLRMEWALDYPVEAINWDDQEAETPSLAEIREQTNRILVGGLDRHRDLEGENPEQIRRRIREKVIRATTQAGEKLIVSGGCDWSISASHYFPLWREVMEEFTLRSK